MSERRERIPAEEVPDPEKWKLPFWTEPNHLVQQEQTEEEEEDVLVEEEEIEVEPLTAEQLEAIRQEAYNEGLQQGLIEGRQKGEKQGHEEGYAEGLKTGTEEGRKAGYDAGFEKGEEEAKTTSDETTQKAITEASLVIEQLSHSLIQQKTELENEIPNLVLALAKAVVMEELSQGSEHITHLVQLALKSLPLESNDIKILVNEKDLPFIEASQEQSGFEATLIKSDEVDPGGCLVQSQYSAIDFSTSSRWQNVVEQYHHQLQLGMSAVASEDSSNSEEANVLEDPEEGLVEADGGTELNDGSQPEELNHETVESETEDSPPPVDPSSEIEQTDPNPSPSSNDEQEGESDESH